MVRLLALDLDGTLLRDDKSIGPQSADALRAAHARGIEIVLASGRMTPAIESVAAQLGLECSIVSYNGAVACARANGTPRQRLFHQPLPADVARELFEYAHARRYQINFYHDDVVLSEDGPHLRPWIGLYRARTGSPYRFVERLADHLGSRPTKMLFVVDPAVRNTIDEELRPRLGSRVNIIRTDPEYIEFLEPSVDKGRGLVKLAEHLGIPMSQVLAMGDGENDVPMLAAAGFPVAVANAGRSCRAVARSVTENDHNHDAVAEAVERWIL